jgi:hypothetical protein
MLLVDAEKPDRRSGEQPVDRHLNVGLHMTRELPRGRNQLIARDAGEMPGQSVAGIVEWQVATDFVYASRDFVHAVIAEKRCHALQGKPVLAGKGAAEFAGAITRVRNRLARDPERMTRVADALSSSFEQFICSLSRIGPAAGSSVLVDGVGKSGRVGQLLLEYRMHKPNDEFFRRFVVVMKDDLEVAGLGVNIALNIALNIAHGIISFDYWSFRHVALDRDAQARTKQEQCHYPNV